jgi:hypothetical protein
MKDVIRKATKADLATVKAWLRAEELATGEGFFCNWPIIAEAFKRGITFPSTMLVAADELIE